jgi:hypothetical protein
MITVDPVFTQQLTCRFWEVKFAAQAKKGVSFLRVN